MTLDLQKKRKINPKTNGTENVTKIPKTSKNTKLEKKIETSENGDNPETKKN